MKKILIITMMLTMLNFLGETSDIRGQVRASSTTIVQGEVVTITGSVLLKGDTWIIRGTEGNSGDVKDYYPGNLGQEFKIEGQRVMVEATLDPIPENVRMAGTPITILKLERI